MLEIFRFKPWTLVTFYNSNQNEHVSSGVQNDTHGDKYLDLGMNARLEPDYLSIERVVYFWT